MPLLMGEASNHLPESFGWKFWLEETWGDRSVLVALANDLPRFRVRHPFIVEALRNQHCRARLRGSARGFNPDGEGIWRSNDDSPLGNLTQFSGFLLWTRGQPQLHPQQHQ